MEPNDLIRTKIARALLNQRDAGKRKRQILLYTGVFVVLFLAHNVFTGMESPLKLIPQTMSAIGMGYVLLSILSLRRFPYLAEWIDWDKVTEFAEPTSFTNKSNFPQS